MWGVVYFLLLVALAWLLLKAFSLVKNLIIHLWML